MGFLHELPVWVEHKMHWEMPALSALHPKTRSPKLPHQTGEGLIFLLCLQFLIFFSLVCSSLPNIFFFLWDWQFSSTVCPSWANRGGFAPFTCSLR